MKTAFFHCLFQTGSTALFFASQQGHNDVVKLLFEFGASTEFRTKVCSRVRWRVMTFWVWLIPLQCYHPWQRARRALCSDKVEICSSGYFRVVLSAVCNTTLPLTLPACFLLCVFVTGRRHCPHRRFSVRTHKGGGHPVEEWSQRSRPAERELPLLLPHLWPL